jgi:hypothetical protein
MEEEHMNRFSKHLAVGAAGVAASLALVAPAFATGSPGGTGALVARGTGIAQVTGHIDQMALDGHGTLVVVDHGGDAKVIVTGVGVVRVHGATRTYVGFRGHARISGSDVNVRMVGDHLRFGAKGDGTFALKGVGAYDTTPGVAGGGGSWSRTGTNGEL